MENTPSLPTVPMASESPHIKLRVMEPTKASANAIEKVNKGALNQQTRVD
jgi:hypothetical protein